MFVDFNEIPDTLDTQIPVLSLQDIRLKLDHYSASQLTKVMSCKAQWAFKYVYDKKGIFKVGQNLQIGNFFHDSAKYASVEGRNLSLIHI